VRPMQVPHVFRTNSIFGARFVHSMDAPVELLMTKQTPIQIPKRRRGRVPTTWLALSLAVVAACSTETKAPPTQAQPAKLAINPAANAQSFMSPFDATPDSKGQNVYFTAIASDSGLPAVFSALASGGGIKKLAEGAPLVAPFGIAISDDDGTLYVADSGVDHGEDARKGGILKLATNGGAPTLVTGTEKLEARGLEIANGTLFFTGRSEDGKAGVFKVPAAGGAVSPVAVGAPFTAPSGIAIGPDGAMYVGDAQSDVGAAVYRVPANGGAPELIKGDIGLGYPAGVALTKDGSTLLISGRDPGQGTDVVYRVVLASKESTQITDAVGAFEEAAGLHRAKGADVFAWADRFANNTGTVYVLK
jgi:sugar lactone lactonase YvrE